METGSQLKAGLQLRARLGLQSSGIGVERETGLESDNDLYKSQKSRSMSVLTEMRTLTIWTASHPQERIEHLPGLLIPHEKAEAKTPARQRATAREGVVVTAPVLRHGQAPWVHLMNSAVGPYAPLEIKCRLYFLPVDEDRRLRHFRSPHNGPRPRKYLGSRNLRAALEFRCSRRAAAAGLFFD
ncbi:hypothetical protein EVAR_45255_1 [Eumeta japonica]|uniref:Uncharacterized protein n=1 Tax=Eumeta variegata TaxID=151549 RepID=A0A4C1XBL8_EUMVA|nr:hypothetical protein EVAR_45255_1 [Eumeta japonica]